MGVENDYYTKDKGDPAPYVTHKVHHVVAEQIRRIESTSKASPAKNVEEPERRSYAEAAYKAREAKFLLLQKLPPRSKSSSKKEGMERRGGV